MINQNNTFKKAVDSLTNPDNTILVKPDQELTPREKARLMYQTKMHIQLEEIILELKKELSEAEEIVGYMPFTNRDNSAIATSGVMGMTYAKTAAAQQYRDNFTDLRGNRMLIFTNERIMFMVIIEYLEDGLFYSYPYESIDAIRLEERHVKFFDWSLWKDHFLPTRGQTTWYVLDFQAGNRIFTETLMPQDLKRFESLIAQIPPLQQVIIDDKVHRNTKFDYVFSNLNLAKKIFIGFWVIFIIVVIASWIYMFATDTGLWSGASFFIQKNTLAFSQLLTRWLS